MLNRRYILAGGLSAFALGGFVPQVSFAAAATNRHFIFLLQRGAADGLATVAPTGDPDFLRARGDLAAEAMQGTKLDDFFALHPKMTGAAALFASREASFVHAVASSTRDRSHFDAQNLIESGGLKPYARKDGWMNRLLTLLPNGQNKAIAIAPSLPLILRGNAGASSYEPSRSAGPDDDFTHRVSALYAEDTQLSNLWEDAVRTGMMAGKPDTNERGEAASAKMVAGLMQGPDAARIVMLDSNGWDTHSSQSARLGNMLSRTDRFVTALKTEMGSDWQKCLVIIATEFGRTVAFNGTKGTDHGTASAAMLFGGNLQHPGKVIADWPGLNATSLYEGRDLKATMRFDHMISDALAHHFTLDPVLTRRTLFPDLI